MLTLLLVVVVAPAVGCPLLGGEGEGEGEGEGDPGFSSATLVDAYIAFFDRCILHSAAVADSFLFEAEPAFLAGFLASYRETFIEQLDAQQANPALDFDAASYAACLDTLTDEDCAVAAGGVSLADLCGQMFVGNRTGGEGCAGNLECAGGEATFCEGADDAVCGTCAMLPDAGDSCVARCAAGLECSSATGTCVPLPGDGDPCPDAKCAEDLACNDVTEVCESPPPDPPEPVLGDPCVDDSCDISQTGLTCDAASNTCIDVTVVQPGQTCDPGFDVASYCINQMAGDNACVDIDGDGAFTCTVLPGLGGACVAGRCNSDLATCDDTTGQCVAWPGIGEACPDQACAEGLDCSDAQLCEVAGAPADPLICAE